MAAAVFLHNAIFTPDPTPPATPAGAPAAFAAQRAPNRRIPHDRQLSSVSSVTLQMSASDHSHPTEPLIQADHSDSSVYLDLLARQPGYPSGPRGSAEIPLNLQGDPVTARERRSRWERGIRRRLKRLRWARRALLGTIGAWAVYNTVRYYVAAVMHRYQERQIFALALGSTTALCIACILLSVIISASATHLGWYYRPKATHVLFIDILHYSSSLLILAPAVVNLALTVQWRESTSSINTLRGRCGWDIDVVWSGAGERCDKSPARGFWLAGALVRFVLTAAVIAAYHATSYKYAITRQPSRRRRASLRPRGAHSLYPSTTGTTISSRSFHTMVTTNTGPVSVLHPSPGSADGHTPTPQHRERSMSDSEPRALRSSRSRIGEAEHSPGGSRVVRRAVSAHGLNSPGSQSSSPRTAEDDGRPASPSSSSEEDGGNEGGEYRYGRPLAAGPVSYASVPLGSPIGSPPQTGTEASRASSSWDPVPDQDLNTFAAHFRALVDQVSRETDEAVAYAQNDRYSYSSAVEQEPHIRVDVLGRTIHRMPTIESLGSFAGSSVRAGTVSRPSTRSNTLTGTDGPPSRSGSRATSLSMSVISDAVGSYGEMGELTTAALAGSGPSVVNGSRSTGSYHTAMTGHTDGG